MRTLSKKGFFKESKNTFFLSLVLLFSFMLVVWTLISGNISFENVLSTLPARFAGESVWNPLLDERIPRLLVILMTGASLSVAGVICQALFQNPLASPGILGISLGGSLCVLLVFILKWHTVFPFLLPLSAFFGCWGILFLLWVFSRLFHMEMRRFVLLGMGFSTFLVALQTALIYALMEEWSVVQQWMEWEAGSTLDRNWTHVHLQLPLTIVGLCGAWYYKKELDLLSFGEEEAQALGIDTKEVRFRLFAIVALLVSGSLVSCGLIPFFCLLIPHVARLCIGASHKKLLLGAMATGAFFLLTMDFIVRFFSLMSCSVGQLTGILGGGFFLAQLLYSTGSSTLHSEP